MIMTKKRKNLHQTTLLVKGIRCNHCESSIKIALKKIPGVKRVRVQKRRQVVIDFELPDEIAHPQFVSAIKNAGYDIE